jgi:hypothetical protein
MGGGGGGMMANGGGGEGFEMMFSGCVVARIIGKGGEVFKALQEETRAKNVIIQETREFADEKPLKITGPWRLWSSPSRGSSKSSPRRNKRSAEGAVSEVVEVVWAGFVWPRWRRMAKSRSWGIRSGQWVRRDRHYQPPQQQCGGCDRQQEWSSLPGRQECS